MAEYVTLKKPDGTVIYPQSVIGQVADGSISGSQIDWTTTAQSYSETEVDTGATWIDGKPIYKKTFSFTTSGSNTNTSVQHGISNLGVIVDYNGMLRQSSTQRQPIPRVVADNNSGYNIGIGDISNTQFTLLVGTSVAKGVQAYVTLWYTKTTN